MDTEELVRQGMKLSSQGDLYGAESLYREADERGSAEGSVLLGICLSQQGRNAEAKAALLRAEERGHPEAGSSLGNLLSEEGDVEGAVNAYERSIALGSTEALLNLGLTFAQFGRTEDALKFLDQAESAGYHEASWAIGRIREQSGDLVGAAEAYRKAADAGNQNAAYGLGTVLERMGNREDARQAFEKAHALGHGGAEKVLQAMGTEVGSGPDRQLDEYLIDTYVSQCLTVVERFKACLQLANQAIGARSMAEKRPQHEVSITNFDRIRTEKETELRVRFPELMESCANVRETARLLTGSFPDPDNATIALGSKYPPGEILDDVLLARHIVSSDLDASPNGFLQGLDQVNARIEAADLDGIIFRPS